jgi:hypothetical protein
LETGVMELSVTPFLLVRCAKVARYAKAIGRFRNTARAAWLTSEDINRLKDIP